MGVPSVTYQPPDRTERLADALASRGMGYEFRNMPDVQRDAYLADLRDVLAEVDDISRNEISRPSGNP